MVRHAMPMASRSVPPHLWPLSPDGQAAARRLVSELPAEAYFVSSGERKAWETLGEASGPVVHDDRFNEIFRTGEPWKGDFHRLRRLYVHGVLHPGWESHADAAERFQAGIEAALGQAHGRDVVIATHGMVVTTWLVSRGAVAQNEAEKFWASLAFPDCLVVEDGGRSCRRFQ